MHQVVTVTIKSVPAARKAGSGRACMKPEVSAGPPWARLLTMHHALGPFSNAALGGNSGVTDHVDIRVTASRSFCGPLTAVGPARLEIPRGEAVRGVSQTHWKPRPKLDIGLNPDHPSPGDSEGRRQARWLTAQGR
jgi:hypothetical protein